MVSKTGNQRKNIIIKTKDDLAWVSVVTNLGDSVESGGVKYGEKGGFEGYTLSMANDIDLKSVPWAPIGFLVYVGDDDVEKFPFRGTFKGNGFRIQNLYINQPEDGFQGLFGCNAGTIENLLIASGSLKGLYSTGGICGMNEGTITDCRNYADINGQAIIGGICGDNYGKN
jgi:hypothetical protein